MVKVNLTVRVPAETRQFIEELSRRYGMGMGDIVAFVFNEFKGEIIKRLEEKKGVFQPRQAESRRVESGILARLIDEEAVPVSEEDYYMMLVSGVGFNSTAW
jgi:hypothetical protein